MSRFHITRGQSIFSAPVRQCFYCERHLTGVNSWTNLEETRDLFRPSTKSYGYKIKVIVCHTCLRAKVGLEPEEFLEHLQEALDNRQDFKNIDHSRIKTIVKNVNYILGNIEENLNNRSLTLSRKSDVKKTIFKQHSVQTRSRENKNTLTCFYCQKPLDNTLKEPSSKITRDHVRPISKHPKSKLIVFSCPLCNTTKSNDEPEIFFVKLKIANFHQQDFKKIPHHQLETMITNLTTLLTKTLPPYRESPALALVKHYDIPLLRQLILKEQKSTWLDKKDDYELLEFLLLCLAVQKKRSKDRLELDAKHLNIQNFEILLDLILEVGWVTAFYNINILDFSTISEDKVLDQFYILNDRGRTALQIEVACQRQSNLHLSL